MIWQSFKLVYINVNNLKNETYKKTANLFFSLLFFKGQLQIQIISLKGFTYVIKYLKPSLLKKCQNKKHLPGSFNSINYQHCLFIYFKSV